ncbi:DUF6777 domain-containing protein [Streptomyces sp. NPDC101166]|uniref:DUF6777 domain-containing protein n=1 Tax=Streptomyces sp. NPDC101166 TaxID=3366120 RepID=UPI00381C33E5
MSVEPPDGRAGSRPTGPPSGPLSGPSQPPPAPPGDFGGGPPGGPPGGSSGGAPSADGPGPHRPWWKAASRTALLAAALVVAVVVALVVTLTRGGGGGGGAPASQGEVFLQAAGETGPNPFTESTATGSSSPTPAPTASAPPSGKASAPANTLRGVDGATPGLYGGTRNVAACDVEKQIDALKAEPAKNSAFASVAGVGPAAVPAYLRSLTPVRLRMDTRVTNHGYRDGEATPYQAVLQSGTAVLVDARGVPRVRCACGNPLTPPVAQRTTPRTTGEPWPGYDASNVVVITPAAKAVEAFVLYDPAAHAWFTRDRGDTGDKDRPAEPPATTPKPSPSTLAPSDSPSEGPGSPSTAPSPPGPASESPKKPESPPSEPPPSTEVTREPESAPESAPETEEPQPEPPPQTEAPSDSAPSSAEHGVTPRVPPGSATGEPTL